MVADRAWILRRSGIVAKGDTDPQPHSMQLTTLNGHDQPQTPWRGGLVVRGRERSGGALLDPTGTLCARLLREPELRRSCGLDRPTLPVVLTRAQLDQIAALIELRHGNPIDLYTTPALFETLSSTAVLWPQLQSRCTMHWRMVPLGGDSREAGFQVQGQRGLAYRALVPEGQDDGSPTPMALIIQDLETGADVLWVHEDAQVGSALDRLLQPHWGSIRWAVLELDEAHGEAGLHVDWLASTPAPHKLLLGGHETARSRALEHGIVLARDGMEIDVD